MNFRQASMKIDDKIGALFYDDRFVVEVTKNSSRTILDEMH